MITAALIVPIRGGLQTIPVNQSNVYFSSKMFANHASINYAWNFANALTHKSDGQNPYKFFKKEVAKNTINNIKNTLLEIKDVFRENYQDQIIMHMIVVDNDNKNDDYLFLEVNFISITNNFTFYFDKLLESHQIMISRYMSGKYIKSYIGEDLAEISIMANKLNNGLNKNEVQLVSKNVENSGFFEKFFQLFS